MIEQRSAERWPAQIPAVEYDRVRVVELGAADEGRRRPRWKQRLAPAFLVAWDVILAFLIWGAAHALQGAWGAGQAGDLVALAAAPNVAAWVGLRALLGLYPGYGLNEAEELRRSFYAVLSAVAAVAVFAWAFRVGDTLPRMQLVIGFLGLLVLAPVARRLIKGAMKRSGLWGKPVMVIGSKGVGGRVAGLLEREWVLGYEPVAVFDHDPTLKAAPDRPAGGKPLAQTAVLARRRGVETVIFATPNTRREEVAGLVGWAGATFRDVLVIPNLAGITNSAVVSRDLAGTFAVEIKHNLLDPWALRTKRAVDLIATAVGVLLVAPLILVLALLVYLESGGGPAFYKDRRMGRDGELFSCPKFRTMVPDSEEALRLLLERDPRAREEYFKYHKLRDDPRVTRVGRFMRKTSLDELPQLWSVLKGEMSLVGPRPYQPRESEDIGQAQREILRVPPGITGPWQVEGRNRATFEDRVQMDAHYVRDWSVWLDLVILARTVGTVVSGRGAY